MSDFTTPAPASPPPPMPPLAPGLPAHLASPPTDAPGGTTPWAAPPRIASTRGLAIAALGAGGLVLLFTVLMAITSFSAAAKFEEAVRNGESVLDTFTLYDVLGLPLFGSQVLAWILTAVWLGQARKNVDAVHRGYHFRRSAVWNWLGWIVPFVNLWFPFQTVRDLSRGSSRSFIQSPWLGLWWGTWLVGLMASQASARTSFDLTGTRSEFSMLPILDSVTAVAWLVAFVLWMRIVLSIVRDQESAAAPH